MSQTATLTTPLPPSASAARPPGLLALLVMLSGTFMVVLDFFIVNVAIPSIQQDLDASAGALQLVVIGYGLANAAVLIIGGRLGDIHGRRRLFMIGVGLFTLASLVCGVAPNAAVLVAARIAQGVAGALLQPQVLAMLGLLYAGPQRAKAFAAYGLAMGLAAASGQIIGGLLIHADLAGLGWRSCFLINLPIGVLALALSRRVLPPMQGERTSRLDLPGMVLLASTLTAAILPLVHGNDQGWSTWSLVCLLASVPLLALFWSYQRRLAARGGQPLVAPSLLAQKPFLLGLAVTLVFFAGNASLYFVLALYLQQGLGLSPLHSGLVFTTLAIGFFATSMASPWFARKLGRHAIFSGTLVLAAGHAILYGLLDNFSAQNVVLILPALLIQGCGLGMVMAPLASTVLAGLPPRHAGVASGVMATVQQVGNALGVALIGILYYSVSGKGMEPADAAPAFGASLIYLFVLALGVALLYRQFTNITSPLGSSMKISAQQLAERYVAVWNEADPGVRRDAIAQLWRPDGVHYVATREARGYAALEERIIGSHNKNVRDAGYLFRAVNNARALRGVVTFNWQMIRPATEQVLAVGLEFLQVDEEDRIISDFQFIVS
jgi:EmrB/QacA subfamily drug resistance transporter